MRRPGNAQVRWLLLAAMGGVALGVAVGVVAALRRNSHAPVADLTPSQAQVAWAAGAKSAPGVVLRDQSGAAVSLRSLRGRVVMLTFLDSRCRRECPLEGRVLANILRREHETGTAAVVVSVDPWADTPASARAFAARAGWSGNWHWLLGSRQALASVWRAYNIAVRRTPGDVLHSTALYLIDPRGNLRAGYLFPFPADAVAQNVRRLADGT